MFKRIAKNLRPRFMVVAEKSKSEKPAQRRSVNLAPAHSLKISRSHSEQLPPSLERFQQPHNPVTDLRRELTMIGLDFTADHVERSRQLRLEIGIRDARGPTAARRIERSVFP